MITIKNLFCILCALPLFLTGNPLLTNVINEFQTDTILGQKIELGLINYGWEIPLYGTIVTTPGGVAHIDTAISIPPYGFAVIDTSVLSGQFYLPLNNGYIQVYQQDYFIDEVRYSDTLHSPILSPPMSTSASRIIFIRSNNEPRIDWYIDTTPTIGGPNDDYPGCVIDGYVYLNNTPIAGAMVTANLYEGFQNPGSFYTSCTTYTNTSGFYSFDSLLPARYWMTASFGNHTPNGELTPILSALWPRRINFHFIGSEEKHLTNQNFSEAFSVSPNPSRGMMIIKCIIHDRDMAQNPSLVIYDAMGKIVRCFNHLSTIHHNGGLSSYQVIWDGTDNSGCILPAGIYFINLEIGDYRRIEKALLLK
uniref:T9SS type A sorting domain-containing protein n=1 Tax=candidate division WOR-3 bacterium TaxID=2052148 RepID=A0A7V3VUM8_UNCW3